MNHLFLKLHIYLQTFLAEQEGQDMVEYALVVALIAFGATAAMSKLSTELSSTFNSISSKLGSAL